MIGFVSSRFFYVLHLIESQPILAKVDCQALIINWQFKITKITLKILLIIKLTILAI